MVCLLKKFNIMESYVVIERWQEGDDSVNECLSKLGYFDAFIGIHRRCVTLTSTND